MPNPIPQTLVEQLLSAKIGQPVAPGDTFFVVADRILGQDRSTIAVIDRLEEIGATNFALAENACFFMDHQVPSPTEQVAKNHKLMRQFSSITGVSVFDEGAGISHQVMCEQRVRPGEVIIGPDSHVCQSGALGAFAVDTGVMETAIALQSGRILVTVPETIRVEISGESGMCVGAKDIMLHLQGLLQGELRGRILEFGGAWVDSLDMERRMVLANLASDLGAVSAVLPSDEVTRAFLTQQGRAGDYRSLQPEPGAQYAHVFRLDAGQVEPLVAIPPKLSNVVPVRSLARSVRVHQVFIGSCTNGRYSDFAAAARMMSGSTVAPGVRLIITPASRRVLLQMMENGVLEALVRAGAILTPPGCGPCMGLHQGVLAEGEVCVATHNRNNPGRMGSKLAEVYIASPEVAAASAITGYLTDPRELAG